MKKEEYINKIKEFIESYNGEIMHGDVPTVIEYKFNCKYYNLKCKNRDAFLYLLDKPIMDFAFMCFNEDLKNLKDLTDFKDHAEIINSIDLKYSGFSGQSNGWFTICICNSELCNLYYSNLNELKKLYEWTKKADAFLMHFRDWFFRWWDAEVEFIIKDYKDGIEQEITELKEKQKQLTEIDATNKEKVLKDLISHKLDNIKMQIIDFEEKLEEVKKVMQNE